jgi:hypothetical protein
MSLKSAALLALIGTSLLAFVLLLGLVRGVWGVVDGVVPAITLLTSLIHTAGRSERGSIFLRIP